MTLKNSFDFTKDQAVIALRITGFKQVDLADELGVRPQTIQSVLNDPRRSRRIAARIDELIQLANQVVQMENLRIAS